MLIKLLLLAAIAYGVWYFWHKFITVGGGRNNAVGPRGSRGNRNVVHVEDMAECPACGIYVAASAPACGRQDCPRRG